MRGASFRGTSATWRRTRLSAPWLRCTRAPWCTLPRWSGTSRPASSGSKCRTTRRADGFGRLATKRRTVHFEAPAASPQRAPSAGRHSPSRRGSPSAAARPFAGRSPPVSPAPPARRQRRWPGRARAAPSWPSGCLYAPDMWLDFLMRPTNDQ
eukprot:scaffold20263_cov57-Phaeocystis_antarctica.AAC.2